MAISSTLMSSSINSQLALVGFKGRDTFKISDAIGKAVTTCLRVPNLVSCLLSGSSGVTGIITNTAVIGISPLALGNYMYSRAAMFNYKGRDLVKFFNAISKGICLSLMNITLTGSVAGVGVGSGIGSFTSLSETNLVNLLYLNMAQKTFMGRDCRNLCSCIAFGIVNHLRSSVKIPVLVSGAVSPIPPIPVVSIPSIFTQIS